MSAGTAALTALACHLPAARLLNSDLAARHPEWQSDKIEAKTGIVERRIAAADETAADLAAAAARKLFDIAPVSPGEIDFVVLCTQAPDYLLPTTACLMQSSLGLPRSAGAFDINLGCSGFVYGLGVCKGLIETGQADRVLLLTADTYSKFIHPDDRSVRTIFGDAGAAALVERVPANDAPAIGPFRYGTNGAGAHDLIVPGSGLRARTGASRANGGPHGPDWLYMNGPAVFSFTLSVVPKLVQDLLGASALTAEDVDMIVPHQANAYMLEALRKRLNTPRERFFVDVRDVGNTVSATIPIALISAVSKGLIRPGHRLMLLGFGVGLSWAGTMLRWQQAAVGVSDAAAP
ncbi:MAG: ketoacyl-ACP synthase III [Proteobacteria bacterium]|nr:ketoacyl-ACP synthase III [Pseudomonadota bacterium]